MHMQFLMPCCLLILQQAAPSHTITAEMRRDDPRLEKRVTMSAPRIQIGDLMERLSNLTGVHVHAEEKTGASDPELTVFLRDRPLADVLDSLWSLMSYKDAEWRWEREGKPGAYEYVLTRPLSAQRLAQALRDKVQADLEAEADATRAALLLPEQERKALAKADPRLDTIVSSPRAAAGQATFYETLTPEQQKAVLRGQESIKVPVNDLSVAGRAFVKMVWSEGQHFRTNPVDGSQSPAPYPDFIVFNTDRGTGLVAPGLFIDLPGAGGYGYLGCDPLERRVLRDVEGLWMLPEDRKTGQAEDFPVGRAPQPPPDPGPNPSLVERPLRQLADATGISILAVLPDTRHTGSSGSLAPYDLRVSDFLEKLHLGYLHTMHKWRGDMLLVAYPAWFHEAPSDVPWSFVRRLRESRTREDGFLSLDDLTGAADRLTWAQIQRLLDEFPVLAIAEHQRWLLTQIARSSNMRADLRSKRGAKLSGLVPRDLPLDDVAARAIQDGAEYVRLDVTTGLTKRDFMFTYLTQEGRPVGGAGISCPVYVKPLDRDEGSTNNR